MNELLTPKVISSKDRIDDFFNEFCQKQADYVGLIEKYNIDFDTIASFTRWSDETYQRVCLNHNSECELILLCWNVGQGTPIHDHDGKKGWVHIVKGTFEEELYSTNLPKKLTKIHQLKTGDSSFLTDDIASHRLVNTSGEKAISLHLYSKPVSQCHTFVQDSDEVNVRVLEYDYDFS